MTLISVAVIVMAIVLVAVAIALIPALVEIRKTAVRTRECIERTEADLKPVIKELHETLGDIKSLTATMNKGSVNFQAMFEAAGDAGRGLRTISSIVTGVSSVMSNSSLWVTGARVASKFVLERIKKRKDHHTGGDNHGE